MATALYQKKSWDANSIISEDDLNNIETGIARNNTGVINLENEADEQQSTIQDHAAEIDELLQRMSAVEAKSSTNSTNFSSLKSSHDSLKSIAVTKGTLDGALEDRMSITTRKMLIGGQTLTIELKNEDKCTLEKSYYKRSSSGAVNISGTFSTGSVTHYLTKRFSFVVANLDAGTSNMLSKDITKFATVTRSSGIAAYSSSFEIKDGKLYLYLDVVGFGAIAVEAGVTVTITNKTDADFVLES